MDSVGHDGGVDALLASVGDVGLDVVIDLVLLYMGRGLLLDKNTLLKVPKDLVADDDRMRVVVHLDASEPVVGDPVHAEDPRNAVAAFGPYAIVEIALDLVIDDLAITADVVSAEGGV